MRDVPEYLPPEDPDPAEETPRRRPAPLRSRRVAIAGGLAAALLLGGIGVAVAQSTSSPSTTTPPAAGAPTVPGATGAPGGPGGPGGRMHGHGALGFAKGGP